MREALAFRGAHSHACASRRCRSFQTSNAAFILAVDCRLLCFIVINDSRSFLLPVDWLDLKGVIECEKINKSM